MTDQRQVKNKRGTALSLLYRLELWGLQLDHANLYKAYRHEPDAWWVLRDETVEGAYSFESVLGLLRDGESPLQVVNASVAEGEDAPWQILSYSPMWANAVKALAWIVSFWLVLGFLAFALISQFIPPGFRVAAGLLYWGAMAWVILRDVNPRRRLDAEPGASAESEAAGAETEPAE